MAERGNNGTGGEIGTEGVPARMITADMQDPGKVSSDKQFPYRSTADVPAILRKGVPFKNDAEAMLEASQVLARRARDAFKEACETAIPDQAEASFLAVKQKLDELWTYGYLRDRPFRDLLALLTAAIKSAEFTQIEDHQRAVFQQAFADLPKMFLDDALLEQHIDRFADHGIDEVVRPISQVQGQRLKVTIEEVK